MGKNLSRVQPAELQGILKKFSSVLSAKPGKTTMISHGDCTPIRQRPYRIPYTYRDEMNGMERTGIITESNSP